MKNFIALLLTVVMCFSLDACGNIDKNEALIAEYEKRIEELEDLLDERDEEINRLNSENKGTANETTEEDDKEPQHEAVELTLENWNEYFEITDKLQVARNEFDEVWRVQVGFYLQLKPAYSEKCLGTEDFAVKIAWTESSYVEGTVNIEDETYEITENLSTITNNSKSYTVVTRIGCF